MPVPNSPHLYRHIIPDEPPPESDEDFEHPMTKPPMPKFTSKFEGNLNEGEVCIVMEVFETKRKPRQIPKRISNKT